MVNSLAERTKLAIFWDSANNKFVFDSTKIGYVYLIKAEGTNRLKIGYSKDPEKRLLAIQSPQSPFKLKLVYKELVADCASFEKFLHDYYKEYRVFGEWFEIPLEIGKLNEHGYGFVTTPDNRKHWVTTQHKESVIIQSACAKFADFNLRLIFNQPLKEICERMQCDHYTELGKELGKAYSSDLCGIFCCLFFLDRNYTKNRLPSEKIAFAQHLLTELNDLMCYLFDDDYIENCLGKYDTQIGKAIWITQRLSFISGSLHRLRDFMEDWEHYKGGELYLN